MNYGLAMSGIPCYFYFMELESYFAKHGIKRPHVWAGIHGISTATVHRYINHKGVIGVLNALRIERACNEEVTVADIVARYKYTHLDQK